jgi:DNA polymerase I-like protein with 3'-5' exonuclease and polymerase domains
MSRIYKEKTAKHLDAKFVLQIHDQLVMEVRDDQVEEVKEIMVRQMETPFMFKGFERVINVDPTVGKTLGDL